MFLTRTQTYQLQDDSMFPTFPLAWMFAFRRCLERWFAIFIGLSSLFSVINSEGMNVKNENQPGLFPKIAERRGGRRCRLFVDDEIAFLQQKTTNLPLRCRISSINRYRLFFIPCSPLETQSLLYNIADVDLDYITVHKNALLLLLVGDVQCSISCDRPRLVGASATRGNHNVVRCLHQSPLHLSRNGSISWCLRWWGLFFKSRCRRHFVICGIIVVGFGASFARRRAKCRCGSGSMMLGQQSSRVRKRLWRILGIMLRPSHGSP